jgi:Na+/phosphate symporter
MGNPPFGLKPWKSLHHLELARTAPRECEMIHTPILCFLYSALLVGGAAYAVVLTRAAHSSAGTALLLLLLAYARFVTPFAALALDANLGNVIDLIFEGARRDDSANQRLVAQVNLASAIGVIHLDKFWS